MKGLETMPIKMILVAFLLLLVVGIGLSQMSIFMNFKVEKDFKEDVVDLVQQMKLLKSAGDYGAFTSVRMHVPLGYWVELDLDNETVTGWLGEENYTVSMEGFSINMTTFRSSILTAPISNGSAALTGGSDYDLRVYYGWLPPEGIKEFTLVFI